jgi:hypothetical protein
MSKKEIEDYLETCIASVQDNVTIYSSSELGTLYHLTSFKQTELTPNVSTRRYGKEDNTLARVSMAMDLIGCILGYGNTVDDFLWYDTGDKVGASSVAFKGGYYLYTADYEFALQPTKKLVKDVEDTNERWLIPYSKDYATYPTVIVGKVFITDVTFSKLVNKKDMSVFFYVEVNKDCGIKVNSDIILTEGRYKLKITNRVDGRSGASITTANVLDSAPVENDEFYEAKKRSAATLSYT